MSQSIRFTLPTSSLPVTFDGPQLTSDGGLCWLSEADTALGLCATVAQHIPEWRRRSVRHSLETLVRQRVFQIACGYEDQDDADTLRTDPLLKLVCGRLPDEADLASQPTLSRFENAECSGSRFLVAAGDGGECRSHSFEALKQSRQVGTGICEPPGRLGLLGWG